MRSEAGCWGEVIGSEEKGAGAGDGFGRDGGGGGGGQHAPYCSPEHGGQRGRGLQVLPNFLMGLMKKRCW